MRALMDWTLTSKYFGIVPYWREVHRMTKESDRAKSMFVCYENVVQDPDGYYENITNFFFPGGHHYSKPPGDEERHSQHSTNHDPDLRNRLRALVSQLDEDVFNRTVSRAQAIFRCGE